MHLIPASHPTSEAKRGVEVLLKSLPPGSRFRSNPIEYGGYTYQGQEGTFLYATATRARVRIRQNGAIDRKFQSVHGEVTLPGQNYREIDWAPDSPVEYIGPDPTYKPETKEVKGSTNSNKETNSTMTAAANVVTPAVPSDNGTAKALAIKWQFNTSALKKALAVDAESAIAVNLREKIQAVYDESVEANVLLDPPDFNDPAFSDMVFAKARKQDAANPAVTAEVEVAAPAPAKIGKSKKARVPASVKGAEDVAARKAAKGASKSPKAKDGASAAQKKASGKTAKAPKAKAEKVAKAPKAPKAIKTQHACLCGCGEMVSGRFKQGHDATYKSLIMKVQREELEAAKLPKFMREHGGVDGAALQFTKVKDGYRCTNAAAKLK